MRIIAKLLHLTLSSVLLAGGPPLITKDAISTEILKGVSSYELDMNRKGLPHITATVRFDWLNPVIRKEGSCYGIGFAVADIERKEQVFSKVQSLSVKWNNNIIEIPNTAYNQLWHVTRVCIMIIKDDVIVRMLGGDGSDSYTCDFVFRKSQLSMRGLYSVDFAEDYNEITSYSYPDSND